MEHPFADAQGHDDGSWIHAQAPDEAEIRLLCDEYGLTERVVRDALDRDEIPRVEKVKDYTYIITRFAYEAKEGEIETAPILFALHRKRLVTISLEKLPDPTQSPSEGASKDHTPVATMLQLLLRIDADYDRFIHDSTKVIRHLRTRLGKHDVKVSDFIRFVEIEDDMNDFLSSLQPTNRMLRHLLADTPLPAIADYRELVDTVILNNDQSIQSCEGNLKAITSIRRTYALINSQRLDRTIKILTLASVFISIPTMFFSMYGMNVGLPAMDEPWVFGTIMVFCVAVVMTAFAVGRKKRVF